MGFSKKYNWTTEKIAKSNLMVLWASQANTMNVSFWTLLYLLRNKEAYNEVFAEVKSVFQTSGKTTLTRDDAKKFIKLESCIQECIRLTAGVTLIRQCMEDTEIILESGNKYNIRKGDRILFPCGFEWHYDTEYFGNDLEKFKWDRFLDKGSIKASVDYTKNGKKSPLAWAPFGAGESLCPGRQFALIEIKVYVAYVIYNLDMELNESCTVKLDNSKYGAGVMCPLPSQTFPASIRLKPCK